jgi:hypothetical protein
MPPLREKNGRGTEVLKSPKVCFTPMKHSAVNSKPRCDSSGNDAEILVVES